MANITYTDKVQTNPYNAAGFNAQDANEIKTAVNSKQDAQAGKGLSTNDYTNTEKSKLAGIATGATVNDTDANLKNRANHTGSQAISTVTGLQTALDSKQVIRTGTKTSHGFGVGWVVRKDASDVWQRCNASVNDENAVGDVIVSVPDANTFVLGEPGMSFTTTGLTVGPYYLDVTTTNTPNFTTTAPTTPGQVQREIFRAISATQAIILNTEYFEVTDPQTPTVTDGSITNAKLATDVKVGSLASLDTTDKSSVVGAINELHTTISGLGGGGSTGADRDYISLPPLSTPGSFTATAASDTQINLTWTDISNEVDYVIQRGVTNTSYSTIASPAAGSTSYNDTGRNAGTQYFYRMKAEGDGWNERDSTWAFANATTTGTGGATVEQEIFISLSNQYVDCAQYSDVQAIRDTGGTSVAAGTAGMNGLKDINAVVTSVNFSLTSAGTGSGSIQNNGIDPNNNTVFGKSDVSGYGWLLQNGTTAQLTGLTPNRTYKLYFWFLSNGWEHDLNVTATANTVTTSNLSDSAANYGDSAGAPLSDAALREIDVVSSAGGVINITFNCTAGVPTIAAIYVQRMSV